MAKKITTKQAVKKKVSPIIDIDSEDMILPSSTTKTLINKKNLGFVLTVLIIGGVLFWLRNQLIVATVNGQPITRLAIVSDLERQYGKKAVDSLVTEILIVQEAKKQNIVITQKEIDSQIKEIETSLSGQGQSLDDALKMQGLTKEQLQKQIKLQKILEKLLADKVKVSEKEIDAYIKENKASIPKTMSEDEVRKTASVQLKQDKLSQEIQKWITDAQKKAKISYLRNY